MKIVAMLEAFSQTAKHADTSVMPHVANSALVVETVRCARSAQSMV